MKGPQTIRALSKDDDPRKRLGAIRRLTRKGLKAPLESRSVVVAQLADLATDPEPFVRSNVAWAMGALAHPGALPALEKLAADPHANARFRVALALGLIGDEAGLPILERLASDPYVIGTHAAVALGELGSPRAVPPLERLLGDEVPFVRAHAAIALAQIGAVESLEAVRHAAAKEMHEKVKRVLSDAAQTLERLSKADR